MLNDYKRKLSSFTLHIRRHGFNSRLPKGHIWEDATSYVNGDGQPFIANIPTEEVLQLQIETMLMDM